ncbi:MAG: MlaD family protein [Bacteroidales bacterium]|jgi:phospholipid/cholesterol/gamma-HCH transport system substrate-binding protein|nr:MlaD family protein [Bacteroidales bacterium]
MMNKHIRFKNKYNKDIAIGVVSLATISFFIWFAFFLKGNNVFSKEDHFYAIYNTTGGVVASGPVFINGMKVGRVSKLDFVSETDRRIKMTISVLKKYPLPEGSVASLEANGLLGGKCIVIIPNNSPKEMKNGSELIARSVPDFIDKLDPLKHKVGELITSVDTLLGNINAILSHETIHNLTESFAQLSVSLKNISAITEDAKTLISSEKTHIQNIIRNAEDITNTLKQNEKRLDNIIGNFSDLSDSLAKSQIAETLRSLNTSVADLTTALNHINKGEGTAGKLIYDEKLYNNLEQATANLNFLLKDLQENPKRYVHFSLFGSSNKKK